MTYRPRIRKLGVDWWISVQPNEWHGCASFADAITRLDRYIRFCREMH